MSKDVKLGFMSGIRTLPTHCLLPRKPVTDYMRLSIKYKRVVASVKEVGIIEPIVVSPVRGQKDMYMVLDGHVRLEVIQSLGLPTVECLISVDDEGLTYNKRVNRLATIQEHFMIVRALRGGASREKLAAALNVNIQHIEERRNLLEGICPEVVDILKDRIVNAAVFKVLRKMKPARQQAVVELMVSVNNLTKSYAEALLAGSKPTDLKGGKKVKPAGLTAEQVAKMERETDTLQVDFRAVETRYGDDVLNLMIGCGYVAKLLRNVAVERYLMKRDEGMVDQLRQIIAATSPDREWSDPLPAQAEVAE